MKKKIFIGSVLITVLIVLASFTSAVSAVDLSDQNKVTITTTLYQFIDKKEILTEVTEEEASDIMIYLEKLHVALVEEDENSIVKYENILSEKGIFGENHEIFSKKSIFGLLPERFRSIIPNTYISISKNFEKPFSTLHAEGQGRLMFLTEGIGQYFMFAGAIMLLVSLILVPLIPIALLLLFGGLFIHAIGYLLGHLIPVRIRHPWLHMDLVDGNLTVNATEYSVPLNATFTPFGGIAINFPTLGGGDSYLFVSGYTNEIKFE
ncbi:MAG: hypothetical protein JSW06_06350 [Thermoplasmatales archaeon]|nr:MAG: hypothetical protein JSW06_06350 [Thermoplasmatales archaeon]